MKLSNLRRLSKNIFRLLKVSEITYPIGRTPKGNLGLTFNVNNDDFDIMLDSVPLSTKSIIEDENNIELKRLIEKYWFDEDTSSFAVSSMPLRKEDWQVSPASSKTVIGVDLSTGESEMWIEDEKGIRVLEEATVAFGGIDNLPISHSEDRPAPKPKGRPKKVLTHDNTTTEESDS